MQDRDERHERRRDLRHRDDLRMVVDELLYERLAFVAAVVRTSKRDAPERRGQPPEAIITGVACDETVPIISSPGLVISPDCVPVLKLLDGR
jgi:hypothetical protein